MELDGGGVGALVWHGGAYNDGNGCGGAGATFSNARIQITIAANGVRGGGVGIRNVMAREVHHINIL